VVKCFKRLCNKDHGQHLPNWYPMDSLGLKRRIRLAPCLGRRRDSTRSGSIKAGPTYLDQIDPYPLSMISTTDHQYVALYGFFTKVFRKLGVG